MATRTLDQVLASLDSVYNPQIEQIRQRQNLIPGQVAEEEKGLQAKQEQAFGDILGGARRRGLGFSGIPLSEQARYTSTEFLPAIARLRQQSKEQAMGLEDAILGIQERRNTFGNQLYQQEVSQDFAERQFQESVRQFNEQMAAQARERAAAAAASKNNILAGLSTGGGVAPRGPDPYANVDKQGATNAIRALLDSGNRDVINRTVRAITDSANRGNAYDKFKLELIDLYRTNSQYGNLFKNLSNTKPSTTLPGASGQSPFGALNNTLMTKLGGR